ncbi:MAG: SusE domain-containing protein [Bacteroidota bacterium]
MMKKLKILALSVLLTAGLTSCEDDDQIVIASESSPTLLEADVDRFELDRTNTANPALTLSWSSAEYSEQTPLNYQIEASSDEAFTESATSNPVSATNSITFSVSELNSLAAQAGLPPFEWNTIFLRVKSFLGDAPGSVQSRSNAIDLEIYTYYDYPVTDFFLVGPASASDWNNDNNNAVVFRDAANTNLYNYTGRFNSGPLKILEQRGAWAPQYGENEDGGGLVLRPTEAADDPPAINDLESLGEGYYTFSVNASNLTFTVTPFDTGSSTPLGSLSISGSALVNGEATLTQYDIGGEVFDEFIWYIPNVVMAPGEFTFTANGSQQWGSTTIFSGTATPDGGNIPVDVEDEYEVWFNSLTGEYQFIPINLSQL